MKNSIVILLLFCMSCNPWVESSQDQVFQQTSVGSIIADSNKIINARHNIDRAIIEFDVINFNKNTFDQISEALDSLNWYTSNNNKIIFTVVQSDSSNSLETIWLSFNDEKEELHVLIQFIPMQ